MLNYLRTTIVLKKIDLKTIQYSLPLKGTIIPYQGHEEN
jgi:hypothetical protein